MRDMIASGAPKQILETLGHVRDPAPRTTIATPDELTRLTLNASTWMRCWLSITAGHGLRRAEADRLCPAQYNADSRTITFRTKGDRTHQLQITDELRAYFEMVEPVADRNTPLVHLIAGRKIGSAAIRKQWEALKKKAGVNRLLRIHDLRRTLAVRIYDLTKDLRAVQHTLGHSNLLTTCMYLEHHDPQSIRPLLNQLQQDSKPKWSH
jgi:site-specific recombinase XerC